MCLDKAKEKHAREFQYITVTVIVASKLFSTCKLEQPYVNKTKHEVNHYIEHLP